MVILINLKIFNNKNVNIIFPNPHGNNKRIIILIYFTRNKSLKIIIKRMMMSQYVIIKSFNEKYISIAPNGKLICDKNDIKDCDTFIIKYEGRYIIFETKPGKYLSSNINGSIDTDKEKIGSTERFEIEWINDDWFALKTNFGNYFSIQKDGKVEANQKNIGTNEKFCFIVKKVESLIEFLKF